MTSAISDLHEARARHALELTLEPRRAIRERRPPTYGLPPGWCSDPLEAAYDRLFRAEWEARWARVRMLEAYLGVEGRLRYVGSFSLRSDFEFTRQGDDFDLLNGHTEAHQLPESNGPTTRHNTVTIAEPDIPESRILACLPGWRDRLAPLELSATVLPAPWWLGPERGPGARGGALIAPSRAVLVGPIGLF